MVPWTHSFRTRLQAAFVLLGLAAIAFTGWQASSGAASALRQATFDRLTAIRETRASEIERYLNDVRKHVTALAADESTISAVEQFRNAWQSLPPAPRDSQDLAEYYRREFVPRVHESVRPKDGVESWIPGDPRARTLQSLFLVSNPHPVGSKDLLLETPKGGAYSATHARYHPMFHRYLNAFGFYDILLITAPERRILYSVMKEVDFGATLAEDPYRSSNLSRAYDLALTAPEEGAAFVDYAPYPASHFSPAAFAAAPIRRAGTTIGVLAIQVSLREINRVMTGDGLWREQGFGATGQAYLVGPDALLRSDLRFEMDRPEEFYEQLRTAGIPGEIISQVRDNGTGVLTLPVSGEVAELIRSGASGFTVGQDFRKVPVLRSYAPLHVGDLKWTIIGEMGSPEALAPVDALRRKIVYSGLGIAAVFFVAAGWLAASVTRPVLALAKAIGKIGPHELGVRVPVESSDEVGQLSAAFNRMSEELQATTVSKEALEVLAGRLIAAGEEERTRVARELHDDLTQRLAAIAIEAGRLEKLPGDAPQTWRAGLEKLKQQMGELAKDVHGLSRRLHPAMLEDLGLVAAVEAECRALLERGGPPAEVRVDGDFTQVSRDTQLGAFRIVQESLRNILRHARATEVTLQLRRLPDALELEIRDNGRGFNRNHSDWRAGLGLASMEERARLLGGRLQVQSAAREGTRIHVWLPIVRTASNGEDAHDQAQSSAGG